MAQIIERREKGSPFILVNDEPKCCCLSCARYIKAIGNSPIEYPKLRNMMGVPTILHDSCAKEIKKVRHL